MVDKIKKVSNPLTIIAIFAGLAEVAATVAINSLSEKLQETFLWFLIGFPILLVLLFFIVLWFKPENLYAPSDYTNEDNFMKSIAKAETEHIVEEAIDKVNESSIESSVKEEVISSLKELKYTLNDYVTQGEIRPRGQVSAIEVLEFVKAFPGRNYYQIGKEMNVEPSLISTVVQSLTKRGQLIRRMENDNPKYYISEDGVKRLEIRGKIN
ncbi:hypothetical protein MKX42_30615 [Paenibacillus sp. FSL R7-0204]|uniref:hypothetical protein n=1 Tax=Paenibacillus sp. FSL R7-0204 TaxID=2921675 RepID=UPI0030F8AC1E